MSQVTLTNHPRFSLLRPQPTPARTGDTYQVVAPDNDTLEKLLESATYSELVAIDFETKGTDYSLDNTETFVVGIGLAWDTGSCYIPLGGIEYSSKAWKHLDFIVSQHPGLVAHNVYFDGGWVRRDYGAHAQWHACTFALYMQLAGEGWTGQRWGLKDAMVDVLMWADTNETSLDEWLIANGHVKGHNKPKKELMYLAPAEILGKYCVLDAEATYLLMTQHFAPLLAEFPQVLKYHQEDFLPHVLIHIDQKMHGIMTDRPHWSRYVIELEANINTCTKEFLAHPLVAPHVKAYQDEKLQTHLDKEPERYLKVKERKEPTKFTKSGEVSKNWTKWYELSLQPPVQSKNWEKWDLKREVIEAGLDPDYLFNIQSGDQLRWLLYERLGFTPVDFTDSGEPAVGEDSLKGMGELGQLLIKRIGAAKELSYLTDYLERTASRPTLHPSFKMPGTVTGRLAGKEPNLQQLPKTKGTLSGFTARPGHIFVDCDVNALEMVVTAELSQDKNLLSLYGPNAQPNDIYSFYASMMPILGPAIRATGYDPYKPTRETLDAIKKQCKRERSIAKLLILSDNYGSGIGKKQKILSLNGVNMTRDEVTEMHEALLDAKSGVLNYVRYLEDQWEMNKGWVYNGYGRPIAVHESKKKDLLNRVVQGTGHDILQLYCRIARELLTKAGITWYPIVMDWHDEIIVEVPEAEADAAMKILETYAFQVLNQMLGGTCPLKGSAAKAKTLAGVKLEE